MVCFEEFKPVLVMVGLQFIYASVILTGKAALDEGMSPRVFIVYRHIVAAVSLAPTAHLTHRRSKLRLGKKTYGLVFLSALIGATIYLNLYLVGLQLGSSAMASAMSNSTPAITFVLAASLGMEKVNLRSWRSRAKIIGTAICVGGAISMAMFKGEKLLHMRSTNPGFVFQSFADDWVVAFLFLLASCFCWSVWLILQVPLNEAFPHPLALSFWMCLFASLQSGVLTLVIEREPRAWVLNTTLDIFSCLYAGIVGSGIMYYIQSWCIARRGPLFCAMFSPLCTVITTILGFLLLHEELYIGSVAGAAAVVVGLYVVLWGKAEDVNTKTDPGPRDTVVRAEVGIDEHYRVDLEEPLLLNLSQT